MSLTLRNSSLAVSIRPQRGGRIDQITDLACGKEWLWHPTGYQPEQDELSADVAAAPPSFDAVWSGGFEEMFPNDAATELAGRVLADHGEVWSAAWQVLECSASHVHLAVECQTLPFSLEKRFTLDAQRPLLTIHYRVRNRSAERQAFMLKLHPALVIEEGDEIDMPACQLEAVELGFSRMVGQPGLSNWPAAQSASGDAVLLNRVPAASSKLREFIYCSNLADGFCAISNTRSGSRFELRFDRRDFPFVWIFLSHGGYQGLQVTMLEPCTSKPYDLVHAIAQGTAAWLQPGEVRDIELQLRVGG